MLVVWLIVLVFTFILCWVFARLVMCVCDYACLWVVYALVCFGLVCEIWFVVYGLSVVFGLVLFSLLVCFDFCGLLSFDGWLFMVSVWLYD